MRIDCGGAVEKPSMAALSLRVATLLLAVGLAACATLPPPADRPFAPALAPSTDSPLVRIARESVREPSASGFRLMPLGLYALDARIELIRRAQSSLDVQYYLIQDDRSGRLFMRSLRDAALRGVRVRLLVDDLYTAGADPLFAGLAAFPNVEVRLFNPFCCARQSVVTRFAASLGEFRRLNHRMHNKLFVADGAIAVMGGRNIADEYFARGVTNNFVDMDVLLVGDVVNRLADIFDIYWNSPQAYSVAAIVGESNGRDDARRRFEHLVEDGDQMRSVAVPPMDMLGQRPLGVELDAGRLPLASGKAVAFADQPGKVLATSAEMARSMSVQMNVMDRVVLSTRRVVISSPYFVPGLAGVKAFADLTRRGVEVVILTNSFAANDVPITHIGYARYRVGLVRAGVDLYELSRAGVQHKTWDALPGLSHGRLHAKVAVIDDSMVYIGSMNLDPRSESTNTELGIVAHSPELARDIMRVIEATRLQSSYRLRFAPDGKSLEWIIMGDPRESVLASEPDVSPFLQFRNMLLKPFVPEHLL
jgi:putative cardiolipin synthase